MPPTYQYTRTIPWSKRPRGSVPMYAFLLLIPTILALALAIWTGIVALVWNVLVPVLWPAAPVLSFWQCVVAGLIGLLLTVTVRGASSRE